MKIYLAGPMTGYPEHNYPAFHAAAKVIRDRGFECINPADISPDTKCLGANAPAESLWRYCMRRDLLELLKCDSVAVLPGWIKSRGARLEVYVASLLGMPIIDAETWSTIEIGKRIAIRDLLAPPPEAVNAA